MARVTLTILFVLITGIYGSITLAKDKPNVVLIFMDNFGWGELGSYGGGVLRGALTPNLDQLAAVSIPKCIVRFDMPWRLVAGLGTTM